MSKLLQSNTQLGEVVYPVQADLSAAAVAPGNARLLKTVNNAGATNFALPAAKTDVVAYIGTDCDSATADAPFGVGDAEAVLLGVFFETADGGGDRHGGGEEVSHRLRGGLGRALRVFAEHRRGGDLGE